MALPTVADLANYLGVPVPADPARFTLALMLAQGTVEAELGQPILPTTYTDKIIDPPVMGSDCLTIHEWPLTALTRVEVLERDFVTWQELTFGVDYLWSESGIITVSGRLLAEGARSWMTYPRSVRLTYTAGWNPTPALFNAVILSVASRIVSNPGALTSRSIGDYSEAFSAPSANSPTQLDPAERSLLGAFGNTYRG